MEEAGKINGYHCEACGHTTVTINRDSGTTSFMIACELCGKPASSQFYRVDQTLTPTQEWYRPHDDEAAEAGPMMAQHARLGGLFLRPIKREGA